MKNGIVWTTDIQSAKTELEGLQKQGNTAANSTLQSNQPTTGTRVAARPLKTQKRRHRFTDATVMKKVSILAEQFIYLL